MSAYKLPITELVAGSFQDGVLTTKSGFKIARAWVSGIVTQKKADKFLSLLVDDGTSSIRIRVFEDPQKYEVGLGDIVETAGYIREYNGRVYIVPDFIRTIDPNTELLRRLEALKVLGELKEHPPTPPQPYRREEAPAARQQEVEPKAEGGSKPMTNDDLEAIVLAALKEEKTTSQVVKETGLSDEQVSDTLDTLLDSGEVFEPKPGKYLAI